MLLVLSSPVCDIDGTQVVDSHFVESGHTFSRKTCGYLIRLKNTSSLENIRSRVKGHHR